MLGTLVVAAVTVEDVEELVDESFVCPLVAADSPVMDTFVDTADSGPADSPVCVAVNVAGSLQHAESRPPRERERDDTIECLRTGGS